MSEYVFRYAPGHGFSEGMTMEDGRTSAREYYMQENSDHYGTIHEEIVRCRDCEHYNEYHGKCHRQSGVLIDDYGTRRVDELSDMLVLIDAEPDGFCAWAVKR